MKNMPANSPSHRRVTKPQGFSLVEVVIAVGIVAFSLLVVLSLFGGMVSQSRENIDRRDLVESVDALRAFLNDRNSAQFDDLLSWVESGKQELVYIVYHADANGNPDPLSETTRSTWLDPSITDVAPYDQARVGSWIKAEIQEAPASLQPGETEIPSDAGTFSHSYFNSQIDLAAVPVPDAPMSDFPGFTTQITIHR